MHADDLGKRSYPALVSGWNYLLLFQVNEIFTKKNLFAIDTTSFDKSNSYREVAAKALSFSSSQSQFKILFLQSQNCIEMKLSKKIVHAHFLSVIEESILRIQTVLADLKDSGTNETKSTAGDKHETALAMIQIEQANMRTQLTDALEKKAMLERIDSSIATLEIRNGSLVTTDKNILYISAALGKQIIEGETIIAISSQSPLGAKLMGLSANATVIINDNHFQVKNVS